MTEGVTTIFNCGICSKEIRKAQSMTWGEGGTLYNDSERCYECTQRPLPNPVYYPTQKPPVDLTHVEISGIAPCRKLPIPVQAVQIFEPFVVQTLEGTSYTANAGDYLMIGVEGERYPIQRAIFEKTYEWIK